MKHLVVLTGAGISKESGLSTFRDKDGLWQQDSNKEMAYKETWNNKRKRQDMLDFYNERRKNLLTVEPNHAHKVLAELEKDYQVSIITQNVDDLHERAGSTNVLHLHGELRKVTGTMNPQNPKCIVEKPLDEPILMGEKAADGSQMRPFVVFFREDVPNMAYAYRIIEKADMFAVIGTSLQVYPAAGLVDEYFSKTIDFRKSRPYRRDRQNYLRLRRIPRYIIDPYDIDLSNLLDFEHIKTTAVEGVDILKEKIEAL
jgi:NAD-dependent deacetylase